MTNDVDDDKPNLIIHESDLPASIYALRELFIANGTLFDRGRVLVEVKRDASGVLFSRPMQISNVIMRAHELCQPVQFDRKGNSRAITLPDRAARMFLELGDWGLQPLAGITNAPLLRADGTIIARNGYDAGSQLFCDAPPAVDVKESATEADAAAALMMLRRAFQTFPFADAVMIPGTEGVDVVDIERLPGYAESGYLAGILTAVARPSLWLAPGLLVTAPQVSGAGSGKGLLARAAAAIAYGIRPAAFTSGESVEFEKRLGAKLLTSDPVLFADNINGRMLQNDTLASVLTERPAEVRVLGYSRMLMLNSAAFVVLTGNGLRMTEDLARRFVIVNIDARMENPESRQFKPGFLYKIMQQRIELLEAALTILRWGRQNVSRLSRGKPLGSYEEWAEWVRDPLLTLGCADPVEETLRSKALDPNRQELSELFTRWNLHHASDAVAASELHQDILDIVNPHKKGRQFVARALEQYVGTRMAGFVLTRSKGGRRATATYALREAEEGRQEGGMTPSMTRSSGEHAGTEPLEIIKFGGMTRMTRTSSTLLRGQENEPIGPESSAGAARGKSMRVMRVMPANAEETAEQDVKTSRWRDPEWRRRRAAALSRREAMYQELERAGELKN